MTVDQILSNNSEYFQCYDDLPKDLNRYKRIIMRDKARAFAIYSGQLMSHVNTIKINEEIFEDQIRNNNALMSEGGDFYDGENRKIIVGDRNSKQNITGFFGVSPIRKAQNKIQPLNALNTSNQSADAGNGL